MNLLSKVIGDTGSAEKPIEVKMTHELAPLHEPVVKWSLASIAVCLLLLTVHRMRTK